MVGDAHQKAQLPRKVYQVTIIKSDPGRYYPLFLRAKFSGDLPVGTRQPLIISLAEAFDYPAETKFAVRSSAAAKDSASASFADIHESYLNVTAEELVENVKLIWPSLWSDRLPD